MTMLQSTVIGMLVTLGFDIALLAQSKRPIEPADCVTVQYLKGENTTEPPPISISPDGTRVAYLVKAPNLKTNENDTELYVATITNDPSVNMRPIAVGDLSYLHWLGNGRSVTVLAKEKNTHVVKKVDIDTGKSETLVHFAQDIDEYTVDRTGQVVVFAITIPPNGVEQRINQRDIERGYRIPFEGMAESILPQKHLFVTRRLQKGWTVPKPIYINSPFTHRTLDSFAIMYGTLMLSLSPNGNDLLFEYMDPTTNIPERWRNSPFDKYLDRIKTRSGRPVLILYHIDSGTTAIPLETPSSISPPLWSLDSRSFVVFSKPPVGSEWETEEAKRSVPPDTSTSDLFWVQADGRKVEMVASHEQAPFPYRSPMSWGSNDSLLVGDTEGTITRFVHKGDHWVQGPSAKVPVDGFENLVSDGIHVVGDMQSATVPPSLFIQQLGDSTVKVLAKLNPQFDTLIPPATEQITWNGSTGKRVIGTLFLPPNYRKRGRYPLVIQTKPYGKWFACDYGGSHFPSFAPQPLADAGIAYLAFYYPNDHDGKPLQDYYPKDYPGGIGEAAFEMGTYDTAVKILGERGLIDSNNVGIIGFSRSGWFTEFALAHGITKYKAATVADNVAYSFSEYVLDPLVGLDSNSVSAIYGGPPSGESLKNWLDYSISFNLEKIHAPLLIEVMGYGVPFDRRKSPPISIAQSFELFAGLSRLKKPAEYYYYPNEGHEPDDPQARLATLERNVDWYRFWLQGYERPNPEDTDQYKRWEHLRELQHAEDKANVSTPNNTAKPN